MSNQFKLKPVSAVIGTAFIVSLGSSPIVNAAENPFTTIDLSSGYMVADHDAEGKCGENKEKEAEGKCGEEKTAADGKCGEGKCGEKRKAHEGKCGEGKCGANKDK